MAKKRGNNEGSISKRSDGLYMARMSIAGKRVCFYGETRDEAAKKLAQALHEKQRGTFVAAHKLTVGEWLDTWVNDYKRPKVRPVTYDTYAMIINKHLKPALGTIGLQDLRPEHLQRYYNDKRLNARTIRLHHKVMSNALLQAEKNGLVSRNVCRLVELPRQTRRETRTLTLAQVTEQLLPTLQEDRLYSAYLVLFMTGLRRGELLGLRWQDVDFNAGRLNVRQTIGRVYVAKGKTQLTFSEPKTEKSRRTIPIPDACLTALKRHRAQQAQEKLSLGQGYQDHGLVFSQFDGKPVDPHSMNLYFSQALKRAGLPPIRLHDARHGYATFMLEQGISPKVVSGLLGHSNISITLDIYTHVSLELEQQAAEKLNRAFGLV
jgi:integrase